MSKISYLQYLQKSGYNVPPFIVIRKVEDVNLLHSEFLLNKRFAVRSSANLEDSDKNSFAGIFETYLNIPHMQLYKYISKVFNSLKNKRVKSYLDFFGLDASLLHMDVLVQEMINCEKAGVSFSKHPICNISDIYIEAVWGLGEQCVSGKSDCDKISVSKNQITSYDVGFQEKMSVCGPVKGLAIKDVELMNQSKKKLSSKEISVICNIVRKLKKQLSIEFEIEWGFAEEQLYLFQLRPITTLNQKEISRHT